MASIAPRSLRAAAPLVRAAATAARGSSLRGAASQALRRLPGPVADLIPTTHPLTPAALRVERARSTRQGESSEQTAITVWFGEGPRLPGAGIGGSDSLRGAMRLGTGVVGAAALAALSVIAARKEESRGKVIDAPARPTGRR